MTTQKAQSTSSFVEVVAHNNEAGRVCERPPQTAQDAIRHVEGIQRRHEGRYEHAERADGRPQHHHETDGEAVTQRTCQRSYGNRC